MLKFFDGYIIFTLVALFFARGGNGKFLSLSAAVAVLSGSAASWALAVLILGLDICLLTWIWSLS